MGGALYPPVQALNYAPLAMLRPPLAYRVIQGFILALVFFAGWVIHRMTEGRVWWPVASLFVMMFPGFSGCIALGQNGMFTFTVVLVGWWQLMRGREVWAGLCWGLLAFKPVWAAAFFLVPLITARRRMAVSMALAGLAQIALTMPVVGWESWRNWLQVGQDAAQEYRRQENWIFLSRDLLGIPRRWLLTFEGSLAKDLVWSTGGSAATEGVVTQNPWDHPLLALLGWGLWGIVLVSTLFVVWRRWRRRHELTGPFPAFVLSGCVLTCYHFMYYDFVVAGLPVLLLFTEPVALFPGPILAPAAIVRHRCVALGDAAILSTNTDRPVAAADAVAAGRTPAALGRRVDAAAASRSDPCLARLRLHTRSELPLSALGYVRAAVSVGVVRLSLTYETD